MNFEKFLENADLYNLVTQQIDKNTFLWQNFVFEDWDKEESRNKIKNEISSKNLQVWTIIDGEGNNMHLIQGLWHFNRLGYVFTKNKLEELKYEVIDM